MPKKDHLSGLADLGQEAGSSQLQSFITVHRHTMVWVPSLPLNPRLSVTPVLEGTGYYIFLCVYLFKVWVPSPLRKLQEGRDHKDPIHLCVPNA